MRHRMSVKIETLSALGVVLEALALAAWSITVLVSGLSGESVVTDDGSETMLGAFMLFVAVLLAGVAFALWKEMRWSTGPAITLQVLVVGGAAISTGFLSLPVITALIIYAILVSIALITVRTRQFSDDS